MSAEQEYYCNRCGYEWAVNPFSVTDYDTNCPNCNGNGLLECSQCKTITENRGGKYCEECGGELELKLTTNTSKEFEKWLMNGEKYYDPQTQVEDAWQACKRKILEILKGNQLAYHELEASGEIEIIENL